MIFSRLSPALQLLWGSRCVAIPTKGFCRCSNFSSANGDILFTNAKAMDWGLLHFQKSSQSPDVKIAEEMFKGKYFVCLSSTSLSLGTHLHPLSEPGCDTDHWCCSAHPFSCSKLVCHGIRIHKIKIQKWAEPQVIRGLWQWLNQHSFSSWTGPWSFTGTGHMNWTEWRVAVKKINWFESWMIDL